ncbi:MAG: dCTP deaminase [Polyangiaceae bacterium]|nr:dCTP deaminase [Polyangiaceae bacterium]
MILSDNELRAAIVHGQLIITPPPADSHITTTSVDLTLGSEFRRWREAKGGAELTVNPSSPDFNFAAIVAEHTELIPANPDGSVVLNPGSFLLTATAERVELPITSRLAARVEGRSTLARLGVGVHVTAPTIHAGFRGVITLEVTHHGTLPVRLRPGLRVCQLIVESVFGTPSVAMTGAFQDQVSVAGGAPRTGR